MAERKPVLDWTRGKDGYSPFWTAEAKQFSLMVRDERLVEGEPDHEGFYWTLCVDESHEIDCGATPTLLAAQLAAEAAAFGWLVEGLRVFSGRVLTAEQAAQVASFLKQLAKFDSNQLVRNESLWDWDLKIKVRNGIDLMLQLAGELEGKSHG